MNYAVRLYGFVLMAISIPLAFHSFFRRASGGEYGVGFVQKIALLFTMHRNTARIPSVPISWSIWSWPRHLGDPSV